MHFPVLFFQLLNRTIDTSFNLILISSTFSIIPETRNLSFLFANIISSFPFFGTVVTTRVPPLGLSLKYSLNESFSFCTSPEDKKSTHLTRAPSKLFCFSSLCSGLELLISSRISDGLGLVIDCVDMWSSNLFVNPVFCWETSGGGLLVRQEIDAMFFYRVNHAAKRIPLCWPLSMLVTVQPKPPYRSHEKKWLLL